MYFLDYSSSTRAWVWSIEALHLPPRNPRLQVFYATHASLFTSNSLLGAETRGTMSWLRAGGTPPRSPVPVPPLPPRGQRSPPGHSCHTARLAETSPARPGPARLRSPPLPAGAPRPRPSVPGATHRPSHRPRKAAAAAAGRGVLPLAAKGASASGAGPRRRRPPSWAAPAVTPGRGREARRPLRPLA